MDVCDEFLIEVDGISIEQNKSEVVSIMLTETEYTRAMRITIDDV
jgi:hypothetical protein